MGSALFNSEFDYVVSADEEGMVFVWNVNDGTFIGKVCAHAPSPGPLSKSPGACAALVRRACFFNHQNVELIGAIARYSKVTCQASMAV